MGFSSSRYETMEYRRCGRSGVRLPAISLGCWHNFGGPEASKNQKAMLTKAFDLGITHFDLANNYGPPPGSAEENVGSILKRDFAGHRDELIISSKAGYYMWPGPYGEWGSKKYLIASLDQSLKRLKLDYVDIFYSHRYDPETPLEETMEALDTIVRQGKALYAGISSYEPTVTVEAAKIYAGMGSRLLIHQPNYSMLNRWIEDGLLDTVQRFRMGMIAFCPLAQGLLTGKYLKTVPKGSRASKNKSMEDRITPSLRKKLGKLRQIADARGQTMAQFALSWVLRDPRITSALIGASSPAQIEENVRSLEAAPFSDEELTKIDEILQDD